MRVAEERSLRFEQDYNRSIQMTANLIRSLKDGTVRLDDVEADESGWRVKPHEADAAGG